MKPKYWFKKFMKNYSNKINNTIFTNIFKN